MRRCENGLQKHYAPGWSFLAATVLVILFMAGCSNRQPEDPAPGAQLAVSEIGIIVGCTTQLPSTVTAGSAADSQTTWSSRDPTKATVSRGGLVTGVSPGTTTIAAATATDAKAPSYEVTVYERKTGWFPAPSARCNVDDGDPYFAETSADEGDQLVKGLRSAAQGSILGDITLPEEVLAIEGMSGKRYRFLINNIVKKVKNPRYLGGPKSDFHNGYFLSVLAKGAATEAQK